MLAEDENPVDIGLELAFEQELHLRQIQIELENANVDERLRDIILSLTRQNMLLKNVIKDTTKRLARCEVGSVGR